MAWRSGRKSGLPCIGGTRRVAGPGGIFGVAVDIGTTTVVAKLLDMADGRCRATQAVLNPQTRFGDDVVSRINYAQSADHLAELQKVIIDCINDADSQALPSGQ